MQATISLALLVLIFSSCKPDKDSEVNSLDEFLGVDTEFVHLCSGEYSLTDANLKMLFSKQIRSKQVKENLASAAQIAMSSIPDGLKANFFDPKLFGGAIFFHPDAGSGIPQDPCLNSPTNDNSCSELAGSYDQPLIILPVDISGVKKRLVKAFGKIARM
jgi:hypothetical protein